MRYIPGYQQLSEAEIPVIRRARLVEFLVNRPAPQAAPEAQLSDLTFAHAPASDTFEEAIMNPGGKHHAIGNIAPRILLTMLSAALLIQVAEAQQPYVQTSKLPFVLPLFYWPTESAEAPPQSSAFVIPGGTILPVRLNTALSSTKSKSQQTITARVMQDIPLPNGSKVREGAVLLGHIVEVIPEHSPSGASISLQFDHLRSAHETISLTTSLRALAGPMEVLEAQTPDTGPGEGDVFEWMSTTQIGGDHVYGLGGPVTTADNPAEVVGTRLNNGVLGHITAKQGTKCAGAVDGNSALQALWVFSSDACGAYGLEHVHIAHAGRSAPTGLIILCSDNGRLKISAGTAMLLRVRSRVPQ